MVGTAGAGNTEAIHPRQVVSAERYLRLLLEETLTDPKPGSSLSGALRALEGAGTLDPEAAERIARDLQLALSLRGDRSTIRATPGARSEDAVGLTPATVGVGPVSIALPGASLHVDGILSDGSTARLEGRLVVAGGISPEPGHSGLLASLAVTDDVGTAYTLRALSEPGAEGFTMALRPPPPPGASWLELGGGDERPMRLVLARSPSGTVRSRPHDRSRPEHYLWGLIVVRLARLLLDGSVDRDGDAGPAVDALVATGTVAPDDQTATQAAMTDAVAVGFDDGAGLHEGIRSVLDARDHLGRRGVWSVLAPAAVVDGLQVRVDVVTANDVSIGVHGVCRPWPAPPWAPLYLTAVDDLGGWYVGVAEGDGPDWTLLPSLDPAAGELVLTYHGPTESASVHLGLG